MNILALKLILAPVIIGGASLVGRRWGHAVSGWLIGLPLNSGPVVLIVALSHSPGFAASTVLGTLSGGLALVAFCLSYIWLALRFKWPVAISGSMLCFAVVTATMQNLVLHLGFIFFLVLLAILAGLWLMPKRLELAEQDEQPARGWTGRGIRPLPNLRMNPLCRGARQGDLARASTPNADFIGIEVVFCGMSAEVADSILHILDLSRKFILRRKTVVDRGDQETDLLQPTMLRKPAPSLLSPACQPPPWI